MNSSRLWQMCDSMNNNIHIISSMSFIENMSYIRCMNWILYVTKKGILSWSWSCWILDTIVLLDGGLLLAWEDAICKVSNKALSSTTETGLQSMAIHFARELVSRSQVDLLSLCLNIWSSVARWGWLLAPASRAVAARTCELATKCFALSWYSSVDEHRW